MIRQDKVAGKAAIAVSRRASRCGELPTMLRQVVHPGKILKVELETKGVSPTSFAKEIDVPPNRISQNLAGKRAVTGDSALRFGHWFGMDPQFWLNLQRSTNWRLRSS